MPPETNGFRPIEDFRPHWMLGGGHRQTLWAAMRGGPPVDYRATAIPLQTRDGDWLVLHDDQPDRWTPGDPTLLLLHGLCGCHAASYMVRLAGRMNAAGVRTFRLDMRGCGAALDRSHSLTHAGRSDDVIDALEEVARQTESGPLWALGVSMGGNQLLRACGAADAGTDASGGPGIERLQRIAAIAPPIDLHRCSQNMQRWPLRLYNWYFIRQLLRRVPPGVRASDAFGRIGLRIPPRTLRELDQRITAPLGGYADVDDYYTRASAAPFMKHLARPTLIVASADDPIVPVAMFRQTPMSDAVEQWITRRGGHVGFIGRGKEQWLDDRLVDWFTSLR